MKNSKTLASQRIEEHKARIAVQDTLLINLGLLSQALAKHDGKLVDKRFFEKFFTSERDSWNGAKEKYTIFCFRKPNYSFKKGSVIHLGHNEYVEVADKKTETVRKAVAEMTAKITEWQAERKASIAALEGFDEAATVKALRAVYTELNVPEELWPKLLEKFDVRYPLE